MALGGVVRRPRVRESVLDVVRGQREKVLELLRVRQKPVLDKKIDEMLKEVSVKKKVIVTFFRGVGRSVGRGFGSFARGVGRSISSFLGRLGR